MSSIEHGEGERDLSPRYWNDSLCLGFEDKVATSLWPILLCLNFEFIVIAQLYLICTMQLLTPIDVF